MSAIFVVVSHLVEVIFIELADKAGKVAVLEVFGQDRLCEAFVLDGNIFSHSDIRALG